MKSVTKSDIVQTVTFTFDKGEKRKAIEQCTLLNLDIKYTNSNKVVATRIVPPEEYHHIFSGDNDEKVS